MFTMFTNCYQTIFPTIACKDLLNTQNPIDSRCMGIPEVVGMLSKEIEKCTFLYILLFNFGHWSTILALIEYTDIAI